MQRIALVLATALLLGLGVVAERPSAIAAAEVSAGDLEQLIFFAVLEGVMSGIGD